MGKILSKGKSNRGLVLHPFFIAIYIGLQPIASNIGVVGLLAIRVLLVTFLAVVLATAVLNRLLPNPRKTGLVVTAGALFLSAYGHILGYVEQRIQIGSFVEILIFIFWLGSAGVCLYWILARLQDPEPWHQYLNIVGAILLIFPLFTVVTYSGERPKLENRAREFHRELFESNQLDALEVEWKGGGEPKDIYYIVLDAYGRQDVLWELYNQDNSEFIQGFQDRGFYIADRADSNYAYTAYSMAAAYNLTYINGAPEAIGASNSSDPKPLLEDGLNYLIEDNLMVQLLRQAGYEIISFNNGYGETDLANVDVLAGSPNLKPIGAGEAFEVMWLDSTIGRFFLRFRQGQMTPFRTLFDNHRERIRFGVTHLSDYADRPGPQFIYSHIIAPHSPYVFGPNGEPRYGSGPFSLLEQAEHGDWNPNLYRDQVIYINKLIKDEVDQILATAETEPIIIIHSDHGSRSWPSLDPEPELLTKLQFPILVALYLPDGNDQFAPYVDISPINITRLLFNRYFGANLSRLPDESYRLYDRSEGWQFERVLPSREEN